MPSNSAPKGLRSNRDWRLLWSGQAISLLGDSAFYITILLWVSTLIAKGEPWAPAAASGVLIAEAVPVLVIGPAAGVFVDRWDRRLTMMTSDACRALLSLSLLLLPALGHHLGRPAQLAAVYAVLALSSALAQFFNPSRLALVGQVVEPKDRSKATGHLQAATSLAFVVGPVIAAPALFTLGVQWALIGNAASYLVSFLSIRAIRVSRTNTRRESATRTGFIEELRAGARFFTRERTLVVLCLGGVIAALGTGAVNTLAVFFVTDDLHAAASLLGILFAGISIGAIAGALLAHRFAGRFGLSRVFGLGLLLSGIGLLGFSRTTVLWLATLVIAFVGFTYGVVQAAIPALTLAAAPQEVLGRVMAIFTPAMQLSSIISTALAGLLASTVLHRMHVVIAGQVFGPIDTIFACSALLMAAAGIASIALLPSGNSTAAERARPMLAEEADTP